MNHLHSTIERNVYTTLYHANKQIETLFATNFPIFFDIRYLSNSYKNSSSLLPIVSAIYCQL